MPREPIKARKSNVINPVALFIIACEGYKSEKSYFDYIKRSINTRHNLRVELLERSEETSGLKKKDTNGVFKKGFLISRFKFRSSCVDQLH